MKVLNNDKKLKIISNNKKIFTLKDKEISQALEYLYKKGTIEVKAFNADKFINRKLLKQMIFFFASQDC